MGRVLAAIWLIVQGAVAVLGLSFAGLPVIMGVLAIVAGILILAGR